MPIRELERRAGLGVNTIHRWPYRKPGLPEIEKALDALGVRLQITPKPCPYVPSRADGGTDIKMAHRDIRA